MPRKKSQLVLPVEIANARQPYLLENDAPWGGFINIRLDEAQKAEFFAWHEENKEHVSSYFEEMLGAGIKASFSYDASNECFILAVTGALMGEISHSRFCSTSRAGTMSQVIGLTVWKHVVLARGDYGNYRPSNGSFMSFG